MNVVIYFKNGNTAYFNDVEDYETDFENIAFSYFGEIISRKKKGLFL